MSEGLKPVKEQIVERDGQPVYKWSVYSPEQTNLKLVVLEDLKTGVSASTTEANPNVRTAADRAWASARHSRAAGPSWVIRNEMGSKGVDPDQKLEETFSGYGHGSPADAARLDVNFDGVPLHFCFALFNYGFINSGQEKSTRYQTRFGGKSSILHGLSNYFDSPSGELNDRYQELGEFSLEMFNKHRKVLEAAYTEYYQPDPDNPKHKSALTSRVLDSARVFLPLGLNTGMAFETSARDWSRTIGVMKASPFKFYREVGEQTERLLAPSREEEESLGFRAEAPSLIRHSGADLTANTNIEELGAFVEHHTDFHQSVGISREPKGFETQSTKYLDSKFSEGDRVAAQYLLQMSPGVNSEQLLEWVNGLDVKTKLDMSKIIGWGHTQHKEMPPHAKVTRMTAVMGGGISENRDWNRHKSVGRFFPLPLFFGKGWDADTTLQIVNGAHTLPLYLTEVPQFSGVRKYLETDLTEYYDRLRSFADWTIGNYKSLQDYGFMVNLLPLSHKVDLLMHGDPRSWSYITKLRVRPGGHINYRMQAYEVSHLIADSDPYLESIRLPKRPDPSSREEFFDRS